MVIQFHKIFKLEFRLQSRSLYNLQIIIQNLFLSIKYQESQSIHPSTPQFQEFDPIEIHVLNL